MSTPYNKGLRFHDYRMYLAGGKSLECLEKYDNDVQNFSASVVKLVKDSNAQMAQMTIGAAQQTLGGLVFTEEIPLGWKHKFALYAEPDLAFSGPFGGTTYSRAINLMYSHIDEAHHYLGAQMAESSTGKRIWVLAAKLDDAWVIACPVDKDGESFLPEGAKSLTPHEYKIKMGYGIDQEPLSPSDDDKFSDHPALREYPFEVEEQHKERYDVLRKTFWESTEIGKPLVPVKTQSIREKIVSSFPALRSLGL